MKNLVVKKLNIAKTNKGFTLVEIIVSLVITSILILSATSMFFMGQRMYNKSSVSNMAKYAGDGIFRYMIDEIKFAGDVQIIDKDDNVTKKKYENYFDINAQNYLEFNGNTPYNDDFYGDKHLRYSVKPQKVDKPPYTTNVLNLTVQILDDKNEVIYENSTDIDCINLKVAQKVVETFDTKENYENPIICFSKAEGVQSRKIIEMAKQMRIYMMDIYKASLTNGGKMPGDWKDYKVPNQWASNDNMREYVKNKYYGGSWPLVPQTLVDSNKYLTDYANQVDGKIYIMPYSNHAKIKDEEYECIIYFRNTLQFGWWNVKFMVNPYTNEIKKTIKEKDNFTFVDQPKSFVLTQLSDSKFCITMYK